MWRVLLGLFILFGNGSATLFFFNRYEPKKTLSYTEVAVYGFSLGYAVLTIIGVALAQIGLLTSPFTWLVIIALPILAICVWIYEKQKRKSVNPDQFIHEERQISEHRFAIHSTDIHISIRFSHLILFLIYAVGIILRLETQLTTEWLGDQDPYYHLAFIDSIVAQGTLPSRTYWGFYSYPPSFHVVFATLISTTHVDRYLLMKVVPEFLGFLCIPAVYVLIKKQYGEWAGITSAAFLAICSFHIYRTNIGIPEPIALLGILMFFHTMTVHTGARQYLVAGLCASMVFLTNVIGILYFLPGVVGVFVVNLILRKWNAAFGYVKATFAGLVFSGVFWLPVLYLLGFKGIFEGLGPSYRFAGSFAFTSYTYLTWIGWGACILALLGVYCCLRDFKNNLVLLIPTIFIQLLIEAGNNGYFVFDTNVLFRSLLFLGTWVSLLAGVGFWRLLRTKKQRSALITLAVMIVLTGASFPVLSGVRYPVNWGYDVADFVYRSYLENYADIFTDRTHMIYSGDYALNYGSFNNVIWDKEAPQISGALLRNETSVVTQLFDEYQIKYLIFPNEGKEVDFLVQSNLADTYYENWHTIVLVVR